MIIYQERYIYTIIFLNHFPLPPRDISQKRNICQRLFVQNAILNSIGIIEYSDQMCLKLIPYYPLIIKMRTDGTFFIIKEHRFFLRHSSFHTSISLVTMEMLVGLDNLVAENDWETGCPPGRSPLPGLSCFSPLFWHSL